jgi:hypothetical protein
VHRGISGLKKEAVLGHCTELHNDGLRNLHLLLNVIRMIKTSMMRWWDTWREMRNA